MCEELMQKLLNRILELSEQLPMERLYKTYHP